MSINKSKGDPSAAKSVFAPIRLRNWVSIFLFVLSFVVNFTSIIIQTHIPNPRVFEDMYNTGVESVGVWGFVTFFSMLLINAPVSGLITLFVKLLTKEISWAIYFRTLSIVQLVLMSPSLINLGLLLISGNLSLK